MAPRRSGTRPQDYPVSDLLEWIEERDLALPEFQRDYDWEDDRVIALVATMMRGWPAGSLLLQEVDGPTFFRLRPFEGGPELESEDVSMVVLDGQQRLTALYQALYDAGSSVYAIRASGIAADSGVDQLEDAMRAFDREEWNTQYRNVPFEAEHDWIPLYALKSATDYFAWRDEAAERTHDPDRAKLVIADAYRDGLERFHKYRFPAVIVESGLEPAAIARIFERVNRQGLILKTFDLMVARTFVQDWNLRDRWSEACIVHPQLDAFFGDDGMPVIRAIALATVGNIREQAVLTLEPGSVRLQWDDAVAAMARTITFLESDCGVHDPAWVPYGAMIITLAAIERTYRLSDHGDLMLKWFLSRSLGLRYEAGANTVAVEEYHHLTAVLEEKATLDKVSLSARMVRAATRKRQGALWRSFMCCLSMAGATKVGLGESVDPALTAVPVLEKAVSPRGLEPQHQLVMNLVLADKREARAVAYEGVARLTEHLAGLPDVSRASVEHAQLIPSTLTGNETADGFVALRSQQLDKWLRPVLGYGLNGVEG
jgi:hypothetical protein